MHKNFCMKKFLQKILTFAKERNIIKKTQRAAQVERKKGRRLRITGGHEQAMRRKIYLVVQDGMLVFASVDRDVAATYAGNCRLANTGYSLDHADQYLSDEDNEDEASFTGGYYFGAAQVFEEELEIPERELVLDDGTETSVTEVLYRMNPASIFYW